MRALGLFAAFVCTVTSVSLLIWPPKGNQECFQWEVTQAAHVAHYEWCRAREGLVYCGSTDTWESRSNASAHYVGTTRAIKQKCK